MEAGPPPLADPRLPGLGVLAQLPDELICYLLMPLDVPDLLRLSQCSKLLRVFVCEEPLWLAKHLARCTRPFDYRVRAATVLQLCEAPPPPLPPPPLLPEIGSPPLPHPAAC